VITIKANTYTIDKVNNSKVLLNGSQLLAPTELKHLDRLLFGSSQYYTFINPSKAAANDKPFTFEMAQEEIAKAAGLISSENKANLSQEQLQCQAELIDLLPAIDEVNNISILLDKKVVFTAVPVSASAR
jgi:hypothetical protein